MRGRIPFVVLLTLVSCGKGGKEITLSGTVEVKEIRISSETGGKIEKMFVAEGDSVGRGQVLFVMDTGLTHQSWAAARAQASSLVSQASSLTPRIAQIDRNIKRAEDLLAQGAASPQQLEELKTTRSSLIRQRASLLSQAEAAKAQAELARERIQRAVVRSPVQAVVLSRAAEVGEVVGPGVPVYSLGVLDSPWVRVYLPERYVGIIKPGTRAEIRTDAFEKSFPGRVIFVASRAEFTPKEIITPEERTSRVFEVHVLVEGARLPPGMYADVIFKR